MAAAPHEKPPEWLRPLIKTSLRAIVDDACKSSERQLQEWPTVTAPAESIYKSSMGYPSKILAAMAGTAAESFVYSSTVHFDGIVPGRTAKRRVHVLQMRCAPQPRRTGSCGFRALANARTMALHLEELMQRLSTSGEGRPAKPTVPVGADLASASQPSAGQAAGSNGGSAATGAASTSTGMSTDPVDGAAFVGPLSEQLRSHGEYAIVESGTKRSLQLEADRQRSEEGEVRMAFDDRTLKGSVIERSHMDFVFSDRAKGTPCERLFGWMRDKLVRVNEFGMDSVQQSGLSHWTPALDSALTAFVKPGGEPTYRVFMLGLADHWMVASCARLSDDEWVIILVDSLSMQFLGRTEEEVRQQIAKGALVREEKYRAEDPEGSYLDIPLWIRSRSQVATRLGASYFVGLMARALGGEDPRRHLAEVGVYGALSTFPGAQDSMPGMVNPARSCRHLVRPAVGNPLAARKEDYMACFGRDPTAEAEYAAYAKEHGVVPVAAAAAADPPPEEGAAVAAVGEQDGAAAVEAAEGEAEAGAAPELGMVGAMGEAGPSSGAGAIPIRLSSSNRTTSSGMWDVPEGEDIDHDPEHTGALASWVADPPHPPMEPFPPEATDPALIAASSAAASPMDPAAFYLLLVRHYERCPAIILARILSKFAGKDHLLLLSPLMRSRMAVFADAVCRSIAVKCGHAGALPLPHMLNVAVLGKHARTQARVYEAAMRLGEALAIVAVESPLETATAGGGSGDGPAAPSQEGCIVG